MENTAYIIVLIIVSIIAISNKQKMIDRHLKKTHKSKLLSIFSALVYCFFIGFFIIYIATSYSSINEKSLEEEVGLGVVLDLKQIYSEKGILVYQVNTKEKIKYPAFRKIPVINRYKLIAKDLDNNRGSIYTIKYTHSLDLYENEIIHVYEKNMTTLYFLYFLYITGLCVNYKSPLYTRKRFIREVVFTTIVVVVFTMGFLI